MNNPSYVRSVLNAAVSAGNDTVVVVTNSTCPICSQYNRHLYSISGTSAYYPPVPPELSAEGGFCPNCTVQVLPFVDGMSLPPEIPMQVPQPVQFQQQYYDQSPVQQQAYSSWNSASNEPPRMVLSVPLLVKPAMIAALFLAIIGIILPFLPWINVGAGSANGLAIGFLEAMGVTDSVSLVGLPDYIDRLTGLASALGVSSADDGALYVAATVIQIISWVIIVALVLGVVVALATNNHSPVLLVIGFVLLFALSALVFSGLLVSFVDSTPISPSVTVFLAFAVGIAGTVCSIMGSGRVH